MIMDSSGRYLAQTVHDHDEYLWSTSQRDPAQGARCRPIPQDAETALTESM